MGHTRPTHLRAQFGAVGHKKAARPLVWKPERPRCNRDPTSMKTSDEKGKSTVANAPVSSKEHRPQKAETRAGSRVHSEQTSSATRVNVPPSPGIPRKLKHGRHRKDDRVQVRSMSLGTYNALWRLIAAGQKHIELEHGPLSAAEQRAVAAVRLPHPMIAENIKGRRLLHRRVGASGILARAEESTGGVVLQELERAGRGTMPIPGNTIVIPKEAVRELALALFRHAGMDIPLPPHCRAHPLGLDCREPRAPREEQTEEAQVQAAYEIVANVISEGLSGE